MDCFVATLLAMTGRRVRNDGWVGNDKRESVWSVRG